MKGVFRRLSLADMPGLIALAHRRVVLAAPGIDEAVAAALVFPDAEKLCGGMTVNFVTKDVTWRR